jgi:hypothetical protein
MVLQISTKKLIIFLLSVCILIGYAIYNNSDYKLASQLYYGGIDVGSTEISILFDVKQADQYISVGLKKRNTSRNYTCGIRGPDGAELVEKKMRINKSYFNIFRFHATQAGKYTLWIRYDGQHNHNKERVTIDIKKV